MRSGGGGGFSEGVGVSGEGFGEVPTATEPIFVYCYVPGCSEEAFGHVASLRTGRSDRELRGSTSVHGCKELPRAISMETQHLRQSFTAVVFVHKLRLCSKSSL